ncbi:diguanylate cyclase domain-containing protein [Kaarinaea lacus]
MKPAESTLSLQVVSNLLENVPVGIVVSGSDGNIVWCNQTLSKIIGDTADSIAGKPLDNLTQSKLRPISEAADTVLVPGDEITPDRWLKHQSVALSGDGNENYTATIYSDISEISTLLAEQEKLIEQLNQLSTVDRESGLLNHRAMLQHLEPLVSRSRRYNNELSLISMEITNLDSIVDDQGPDAASQSVVEISRLLKDQLRWADVISRVEYNRFLIILPETGKDAAVHLANKLSTQVSDLEINFENSNFKLEAGFGVTGWEKGNDSVLMLRKANQALDTAKEKGNNMIEAV